MNVHVMIFTIDYLTKASEKYIQEYLYSGMDTQYPAGYPNHTRSESKICLAFLAECIRTCPSVLDLDLFSFHDSLMFSALLNRLQRLQDETVRPITILANVIQMTHAVLL